MPTYTPQNPPSDEQIRTSVHNLLSRYFGDELPEDDINIFETGYVNSMFTMQLVSLVEKDFDVIVADDDLSIENFQSVSAILRFVLGKYEAEPGVSV